MRLFIAIDFPEEAKAELRKAQQHLSHAKATIKKDFHMTLKFLGEVTPDDAGRLQKKLREIEASAFKACIDGIGVFPSEKYIRVIWAGLKPEDETIKLQKKINSAIGKEFPDDHKFSPHITLARIKHIEDKNAFLQQLKKTKLEKISFTIDSFKLKKSTLRGKEGPSYEDLEIFRLNH
ncbi:RNA 2',3'-cyclic phosphodiesterase [Candidatus Woesearchaeota archaeon]|nr:RNA 2',3'-cyclic phosphodiesterase [Candidatus Woesearchaeota archaeon]